MSIDVARGEDLRPRTGDGSSGGGRVIFERLAPDGAVETRVVDLGEDGLRLECGENGSFELDRSGSRIRCAPSPGVPDWAYQRVLVGQALPLATCLSGLEPLHASAVAVGGVAVAVTGTSGAGKSSVAAHLMLQGCPFVADDVVALDVPASLDSPVTVHPGAGQMSLRRPTLSSLPPGAIEQLGTVMARPDDGVRLELAHRSPPLPLGAFYRLRRADTVDAPVVRQPEAAAPALLGATFVTLLRTPERLGRQLDLCATLARTTRIADVLVPPGVDYGALADVLLADVEASSPVSHAVR